MQSAPIGIMGAMPEEIESVVKIVIQYRSNNFCRKKILFR